MYGKKAWRQSHKNAANNTEQVRNATTHETAAVQPPAIHYENYPS